MFAAAFIALQIIHLDKISVAGVTTSLAKIPMLQAMILGLVISLSEFQIPAPVQTFLDFNGAAAAPVALFALGVAMSETKITIERSVVAFSVIKMLVFPFVVWAGI